MYIRRERVLAFLLVRRSSVKRWLSHLYRAVCQGLQSIIWFLFPHLTYPRTLLWVCMYPTAKMDLEVKASGRSKIHYGRYHPLTFNPRGAFSVCVVSPLSPKSREQRSLNSLSKQGFAPLCPCHDYYFKNKHWLFTLFLLLFPFPRANRRLIVNAVTGAHLSFLSGNANRRLVVSILPEAHFFLPRKM